MNYEIPEAINVPQIAVEIEIERRLQRAVVAHEPHRAKPATRPLSDLETRGYSPRAIAAIDAMRGPALQWAQKLLPMAMADGLIVLAGGPGTGKTVLATWLAAQREAQGKNPGRFLTAYELFGRMKQCWAKNEDAESVLATWKRIPFLVIDEAQTRAGTDWENNVIDELINARYARMLPTVIIANLTLPEAQKSLGPRIMDRANECGGVVDCNWPSYRS